MMKEGKSEEQARLQKENAALMKALTSITSQQQPKQQQKQHQPSP